MMDASRTSTEPVLRPYCVGGCGANIVVDDDNWDPLGVVLIRP
jgi:hypothetical protein